jgi:putative nucleotidyltransferase with HDIG domain
MRHGVQVGLEARRIAMSLGLPIEMIELADTAGLLHDIGRFEQFTQYKTFVDHRSIDHAKLGATILKEQKVLADLDEETAGCILYAIEHHNRYDIPSDCPERDITALKILRDADKIDILRIMTEFFDGEEKREMSALTAGLKSTGPASREICDAIETRRTARVRDVKNLNDLKLFYLSWVFDLHFPYTISIFRERGYLDRIENSIAPSQKDEPLFGGIQRYFSEINIASMQ